MNPTDVSVLVHPVLTGLQAYLVYLCWKNRTSTTSLEKKFDVMTVSLGGKFQTMVDTAILLKAMAKSFSKDSKQALCEVKEEVKKGVETATLTAQNLAAGVVPPSDPKIPKPLLPNPC